MTAATLERPFGPPPAANRVGERERFSATMVLSLLVHAMLILGIGFALEQAAPVLPTLDVMLTRATTPLTPKQADFLAQANNTGGGDRDQALRPTATAPGESPEAPVVDATLPSRATAPAPRPDTQARVVSSPAGDLATPRPQPKPRAEAVPLPDATAKLEHDLQMTRLAAEIHLRSQRYAKRPKRKFVSASTREYAWAAYLRQWVDRVERVGNLNYPDEARRRHIGGVVVINIGIRRNGRVERIDIIQSSRIPMLDEAAIRIARIAEPYAPLPKTEEDPDILNVVRTWQFLPGGEMIDR